jgi:hypothetical protein
MESSKLAAFSGTPGNAIASSSPALAPDFLTMRAPIWTTEAAAPRPFFTCSICAVWPASSVSRVYGGPMDRLAIGSPAAEPVAVGDAVAAAVDLVAVADDADVDVVGAEPVPHAAAKSAGSVMATSHVRPAA